MEKSSSRATVESRQIPELRGEPKNLHDVFQICLLAKKLPREYSLDAMLNLKLNIPDHISFLLSTKFNLDAEKFIRMIMKSTNMGESTIKRDIKLAMQHLDIIDINVDDLDYVDYLNLWKYWYPCAPEDYCNFKTYDLNDSNYEFTKFQLCEICMSCICHGTGLEEYFKKSLREKLKKKKSLNQLMECKIKKFLSCLTIQYIETDISYINDVSRPKLNRDPRSLHCIFHLIYFCKRLKGECQRSFLKQLTEKLPSNVVGILTLGMRKKPQFLYRNLSKELDETTVLDRIKNYVNEYYNIDDSKWLEFNEDIKVLYWKKWYVTTKNEFCDFNSLYADDENISYWSKYRLCEICTDSLMTTQYSGEGILPDIGDNVYKIGIKVYEEIAKSWHERVFSEKPIYNPVYRLHVKKQ